MIGNSTRLNGAELILQPLSEATRTSISPPTLRDTDYVFCWMSADESKFVVEVASMKPCCGRDECELCHGVGLKKADHLNVSQQLREVVAERVVESKWLGKKRKNESPENAWLRRNRYELAPTDLTALVLLACIPDEKWLWKAHARLDVRDGHTAKLTLEYLAKRFLAGNKRAEMVAKFKLTGEEPPLPDDWLDHADPDLQLESYQRAAVIASLGQEGYALFMDKGTGKTATTIRRITMEAMRKHERGDGIYRVLAVVPGQTRQNWVSEAERFATVPGKAAVARGGQLKRVKTLVQAVAQEEGCYWSLVVISYDSLVSSIEAFGRVPWDLVVCDESHKFKSPGTSRWKNGLRVLRQNARAAMPLTGTPIGNTPMDLWTQLEFCEEGGSGFVDYKAFRQFHGVWDDDGQQHSGVSKLLATKNIPMLQERLARISFQITKKEAGLNLPDKIEELYEVEMTKEQAEIYRQVATQLALEIEDKLTGDIDEMTVENILTKLLRLAQVTSGHVVFPAVEDPDTGETISERKVKPIDGNPKLDAVWELLTEDRDPNGKTVIWCTFVPDIKAICSMLESKGWVLGKDFGHYYGGTKATDRDAWGSDYGLFNVAPNFKAIICNPATAGEGLNLIGYDKRYPDDYETNCDMSLRFSRNWSFLQWSQSADRTDRRGTRVQVRHVDLVVLDTVDHEMYDRVRKKQSMSDMVLDIRDILKRALG